jgi:hypothetical protein
MCASGPVSCSRCSSTAPRISDAGSPARSSSATTRRAQTASTRSGGPIRVPRRARILRPSYGLFRDVIGKPMWAELSKYVRMIDCLRQNPDPGASGGAKIVAGSPINSLRDPFAPTAGSALLRDRRRLIRRMVVLTCLSLAFSRMLCRGVRPDGSHGRAARTRRFRAPACLPFAAGGDPRRGHRFSRQHPPQFVWFDKRPAPSWPTNVTVPQDVVQRRSCLSPRIEGQRGNGHRLSRPRSGSTRANVG